MSNKLPGNFRANFVLASARGRVAYAADRRSFRNPGATDATVEATGYHRRCAVARALGREHSLLVPALERAGGATTAHMR
jgi:L-amino acid N-acyltransferase YncA